MHRPSIGHDARTDRASTHPRQEINVAGAERAASAILGGTLVVLGLGRRTLGGAVAAIAGGGLIYRGVSGNCHLYRALGVSSAEGERHDRAQVGGRAEEPEVARAITIERPADELYRRWHEPGVVAQVMGFFADVRADGEDALGWRAHGPFGTEVAWRSRIVEERENELIRWEIVPGGGVGGGGSVEFRQAPADRGTEMMLRVRFEPPGGVLGEMAMKFMGGLVPKTVATKALHRFKSLVLTGEIPTTERQPAARADTR